VVDAGEPVAGLYRPGGGELGTLLDRYATRLGTTERRVAASLLFQGYAAGLWSPSLGCLVDHGLVPELPPEDLRWRYPDGGPLRLHARRPAGWRPAPTDLAGSGVALTYRAVVETHLEPLVEALAAADSPARVAPGLLWGNAASALVGTLHVLEAQVGRECPLARRVVELLLATGRLRGAGRLTAHPAGPVAFRRASCCLYYRVPGGGLCGDCVLGGTPRHANPENGGSSVGGRG
jgi:ferric iron reductase protein FhuF